MNSDIFKTTKNNPPHLFLHDTVYMLTASIYQKVNLIESPLRKTEWRNAFYESAKVYGWQVVAWVVLNNHYHAMVQSPDKPETLSKFTASYHKYTARKWNKEDQMNGRKVWWNYWDSCIRSETDYENRLRYIFWNPVKHELAQIPEDYPFSSYKEFLLKEETELDFTNIEEVADVPEF